jgi:hypothetical protein
MNENCLRFYSLLFFCNKLFASLLADIIELTVLYRCCWQCLINKHFQVLDRLSDFVGCECSTSALTQHRWRVKTVLKSRLGDSPNSKSTAGKETISAPSHGGTDWPVIKTSLGLAGRRPALPGGERTAVSRSREDTLFECGVPSPPFEPAWEMEQETLKNRELHTYLYWSNVRYFCEAMSQ